MTLDQALAYDAAGELPCEQWCSSGDYRAAFRDCNCGLEPARSVITILQAEITRRTA